MDSFDLVDGILEFAIEEEERAADMYLGLALESKREDSRLTYEDLAREEKKHRQILEEMRDRHEFPVREGGAETLGVVKSKVTVAARPDLDYPEILVFAMQQEEKAIEMYEAMAGAAADKALKQAIEAIAGEERQHKLRLQAEYDASQMTG